MAELILGAVAFGVATPGVILAFAECGEYIQKRVQTFKNAPAIIEELGRFGRDLHQVQIKINLELAEWASSLEDVDPVVKASIGDYITKLRTVLIEVEHCLSSMVDKDGQLRRFYFTVVVERKAQHIVKNLKSWQVDFFNVIHLIEPKRRVLPSDVSLPWNRYRPKSCSRMPARPDLLVGTAEIIRDNYATAISVLVEQKEIHDENTVSNIREVAAILASRSYANASGGGILKCLGYRLQDQQDRSQGYELVFELPTNAPKLRVLNEAIMADQGAGSGVRHSLDSRYRLARQLCDIVFSVFASGLVHKNIRTNTILLAVEDDNNSSSNNNNSNKSLPTTPPTPELGNPYLTTWTLLRKAASLTSGPGAPGTHSDLYRHPKRQGIQPEQRYNFGHDLYSLGGVPAGGGAVGAVPRAVVVVVVVRKRKRRGGIGIGPVQERGGAAAPRRRTTCAQRRAAALARTEMPRRLGTAYAELVVACLTCLEGGMGDAECFRKSRPEAAIRFNDFVSQSFAFTSM
ncbi:hypothetical protein B5807_08551 [Epicoccum nigrum]|uniref:Prion-inhibition and propagation HeLo domain-containing protein n=1 Tax=Epicoccum nigrum TaxID=105696 RepID=A0A1Y2LQS0_EPING|nr:hypothetical protein B5807_08551 [Epicoccum nigrum]